MKLAHRCFLLPGLWIITQTALEGEWLVISLGSDYNGSFWPWLCRRKIFSVK